MGKANKIYDNKVHVIKDVTLDVKDKEFLVLVGPLRLRKINASADDCRV